MATMRDIKRRRVSISSTQQITKAMKLVSTVKLQKARTRAENSKAYFNRMYETVASILSSSGAIQHPYLQARDTKKIGVVVVTSNRGLAGGYNSNITKLITGSQWKKEELCIYAVGKKGADGLASKGYQVVQNYSDIIEDPMYSDAQMISKQLLEDFANGEIDEIYLAYTFFKNTVSHVPTLMKLLPVEVNDEAGDKTEDSMKDITPMNFEPSAEEAIDLLVPKYIASLLYGAFVEAVASENGARMAAMDNATNNADEMINDLALKYNRARQGAITQELTEIIAGAEAIN
ncbi:MAG: ATP synthase F1 subunit gamma [Eubacteriales bacterium]